MSRPLSHSPEAAAQTFAADGLSETSLSAEKLVEAIRSGQPLNWKPGRRGGDEMSEMLSRVAHSLKSRHEVRVPGVRLLNPLMWGRLKGTTAERIAQILADPGYHAVAKTEAENTGVASFVFDASIVPDWKKHPALRWPLNIVAADDDLLDALREQASSVARGFVRLWTRRVPPIGSEPYVDAQVVEWADEKLGGEVLALRFIDSGPLPPPLPRHLRLSDLQGIGTAVLLPVSGLDLASISNAPRVLSDFVNEVTHDLPLDVAAWEAVRLRGASTAPLVFAPNGFLRRSRISDTVPLIQKRLRQLGPQTRLALSSSALEALAPSFSSRVERSFFRATDIADLLKEPRAVDWSFEEKGGEALVELDRAVSEMEGRGAQSDSRNVGDVHVAYSEPPEPPEPDREKLSKSVATGPSRRIELPRDISMEELFLANLIESPPPPPRYTDIQILDANKQPRDITRPFIAKQTCFLDVAIRAKRIGLTRDDANQKPPRIQQTDTVTIWVVVTDESDGRAGLVQNDPDNEGPAPGRDLRLRFKKHFGRFTLPVTGDSIGSAVFEFEPDCKTSCTGRVGIRLYHNLNLIDHLQLDMALVTSEADAAAITPAQQAVHVTQKEVDDDTIESIDPRSEARVLTISVAQERDDLWRFALVTGKPDEPGVPWLSATRTLSQGTLDSFITTFRDILLKAAFNEALYDVQLDANARDELLSNLGSLGVKLVTELFDYSERGDFFALGQMLREAAGNAAIVQIVLGRNAKHFVLPWQILPIDPKGGKADPNNLWGYRFAVEVRRWGDGTSRPALPGRAQTSATYARWNFANEAQHFIEIERLLKSASIPVTQPTVDSYAEFLKALLSNVSSMLYVYAHGHAATPVSPSAELYRTHARQKLSDLENLIGKNSPLGPAPEVAAAQKRLFNEYLNLTQGNVETQLLLKENEVKLPELLIDTADLDWRFANAPIVFLNTCESAQIWNCAENSFVGFFLDQGARAVVGTESTIPMVMADVFGRQVIEALAQGKTLGEAVLIARRYLLQSCGNPLGLCYSIYGTADAVLLEETKS